jgi:hypothetical protein
VIELAPISSVEKRAYCEYGTNDRMIKPPRKENQFPHS